MSRIPLLEQSADAGSGFLKRGAQIATRIREQILNDRLPVGHMIGSEAELIERYDAGRSTIREAIRQLEAEGVAATRRGCGGGLMVAESPRQSVMRTLASHMELIDIPMQDLFEVLAPLEIRAARLAAEQGGAVQIGRLRQLAEELAGKPEGEDPGEPNPQKEIRDVVAGATGNHAMELFIGALSRSILELAASGSGFAAFSLGFRSGVQAKLRMIEAIVEGRPDDAAEAMREDLAVRERHTVDLDRGEAAGRGPSDGTVEARNDCDNAPKLAQRLAILIAQRIAREELAAGEVLGTEVALLKRLGVSRTTFREAIRLLELHGIVRAHRGYLGGLRVGTPDPRYTIQSAASYIKHLGIDLAHLEEVREQLEILACELAAHRGTPQSHLNLSAALQAMIAATGSGFPQAALEVQHRIAVMSGNRALSLLIDVMLATNWTLQKVEPTSSSISAFRRSNRKLVEAILARNAPLARLRAVEHVRRSRAWVQSRASRM